MDSRSRRVTTPQFSALRTAALPSKGGTGAPKTLERLPRTSLITCWSLPIFRRVAFGRPPQNEPQLHPHPRRCAVHERGRPVPSAGASSPGDSVDLLVKFAPSATAAQRGIAIAAIAGADKRTIADIGVHVVSVPAQAADNALATL